MALEKELEVNNTGYNANYLRIIGINYGPEQTGGKLILTCGLYKDKKNRDDGKDPINNVTVTIENEAVIDNIVKESYNYLKDLPAFKGAKDA